MQSSGNERQFSKASFGMQACCSNSLEEYYKQWLARVGASDDQVLPPHLEKTVEMTIGRSSLFRGRNHAIKVARFYASSDYFTWAHYLPTKCKKCKLEITLLVITSNAVLYFMQVLLVGAQRISGFKVKEGQTRFLIKPHTNSDTEAIRMAMAFFNSDDTPDEEKLIGALITCLKGLPRPIKNLTESMYGAMLTWLILHETGHDISDTAVRLFDVKQFSHPLANLLIENTQLGLPEPRKAAWIEEVSADIHASLYTSSGIAKQVSDDLDPTDARQHGRDLGFGAGIVTLTILGLAEAYDAGIRSASGQTDITRDIAFRHHPPVQYREHFLKLAAHEYGGINETVTEPLVRVLEESFREYASHYPFSE